MPRPRLFLGLFLALAALFAQEAALAAAEPRRVALVVGNNDYVSLPALSTAVADARAISAHLAEERGFEVIALENATMAELDAGVEKFLSSVGEGDIALVAFAGHGIQLEKESRDSLFLIPVDMPKINGAASHYGFSRRALSFSGLSTALARRGAALRVFVLDACRDNPFGTESVTRGLGQAAGLGALDQSEGEFVIFSAAPGERALDRLTGEEAENSVFTRVFLNHFQEGAFLEDVANATQAEVVSLTSRRDQAPFTQKPYYVDGVLDPRSGGKACIDAACGVAALAPAPAPAPVVAPSEALAAEFYTLCKSSGTGAACRKVIELFPGTAYAELAALRLQQLGLGGNNASPEGQGEVIVATAPPSDAARAAAAEEAAAAYRAREAEAARAAAEAEAAAEAREKAEAEAAAVASQVETAPARAEAWEKLAESWDDRAIRSFADAHEGTPEAKSAADRLAWLRPRLRQVQRELSRLGHAPGPADGLWGPRSARALVAFQRDAGLSRTGRPSGQVLAKLKAAPTPQRAAAPAPAPVAKPTPAPQTAPRQEAEPGPVIATAPAPAPVAKPVSLRISADMARHKYNVCIEATAFGAVTVTPGGPAVMAQSLSSARTGGPVDVRFKVRARMEGTALAVQLIPARGVSGSATTTLRFPSVRSGASKSKYTSLRFSDRARCGKVALHVTIR